ncbi:GMC family oxidoreductase [Streptomyces spiralis]
MRDEQRFDHIVVGAGSAGCAVAGRLSEDPACSVLLLEAGGHDTRPEIHRVDLDSLFALWTAPWSAELDWGYSTEPEPQLDGRRIPVARGKVLGGCSAVNALMWVRGNRRDYDRWSDLGCKGWSYDEVLPHFRNAEAYPGGDAALRGRTGPISVRDHARPTPVAEAFVEAARQLGFAVPESGHADYNGQVQEGFGFLYQATRTAMGERCSAATGYLRPAARRPNLTVLTGAQATRVLIRRGRAEGVRYLRDGRTHTAWADGEVVVSAGAFESPKLLMLSGVGPAPQLARHGIPCVRDLPGVGENLQDHLFVPLCHQSRREHPAAELVSEAGLFTRSRHAAEDGSPDLQFAFGTAKFLPADAAPELAAGPGFTLAPVLLTPRSRGAVTLAGTDPLAPARVEARYLSAAPDRDILVEGLELARELAHQPAFDDFRGPELAPGPAASDTDALAAYVAANATTLWHPAGTCRMGTGSDAVVDEQLRVHGIEDLRVADASVMPTVVAGNTHAPSVMIGEKAAALLRHHRTPA